MCTRRPSECSPRRRFSGGRGNVGPASHGEKSMSERARVCCSSVANAAGSDGCIQHGGEGRGEAQRWAGHCAVRGGKSRLIRLSASDETGI